MPAQQNPATKISGHHDRSFRGTIISELNRPQLHGSPQSPKLEVGLLEDESKPCVIVVGGYPVLDVDHQSFDRSGDFRSICLHPLMSNPEHQAHRQDGDGDHQSPPSQSPVGSLWPEIRSHGNGECIDPSSSRRAFPRPVIMASPWMILPSILEQRWFSQLRGTSEPRPDRALDAAGTS